VLSIKLMGVSFDGKALPLGIFEYSEFPEVFTKSIKARLASNEDSFIDTPMSKAFWAANGRGFYFNSHDIGTLYRVELDSKTYKIRGSS